jgi:FtsZ-interacting cell division protein ZipA
VSASSTPPNDPAPWPSPPEAPKSGHKRPIVWMIVAGIAVVAAIGLGVWAVSVHSDLEASQADLAAQTAATQEAQAQAQAQADAAAAVAAEVDKINADNEVYVVSNDDVAQAESDVAAAEEAVNQANAAAAEASAAAAAAQDEASKLRAELEQARAERDLARAQRQQARLCARGSLGVFSSLGKSPEEAAAEMETISSACAASVSG